MQDWPLARITFNEKYMGGKPGPATDWLYVAVLPLSEPRELGQNEVINSVKRDLLEQFREKHKRLPTCSRLSAEPASARRSRKNRLLPARPPARPPSQRLRGRCTCPLPFISRSIDNAASDHGQCVQIHLHASHRPRGLQRRVVPYLQSLKSSPARHGLGWRLFQRPGTVRVNHVR